MKRAIPFSSSFGNHKLPPDAVRQGVLYQFRLLLSSASLLYLIKRIALSNASLHNARKDLLPLAIPRLLCYTFS